MPSEKTSSDPTKFEETPKTEEQDYEKPLGGRESNSVYDFLYQDVRRVASFLAQFEEHGVRQSVKATESVGNTQTVKGSATGTIVLPAIIGGSANLDSTTADETKDIAEHVFDPLWSNSRRLLNYLEDHDLIYRNIDDARLGQFILVNGSISILDSAILDHAFNDVELFEALYLQARKEGGVNSTSDLGLELKRNLIMVSKLPRSIQLFFYDFPRRFWATLTTESLVTSAHDISAKHGAILSGSWNMLGILDAWPDFRGAPSDEDPDPKTLDELGVSVLDDGFLKVAANFTNLVRNTLGRPRSHFGVTPLLIFRTVSGPDEN